MVANLTITLLYILYNNFIKIHFRWNPDLNWQPIPVWTIPATMDCLYTTPFSSKFHTMRNLVEETDEDVIQFEKDNKDIYKYLSEHTGGNVTQSKVFSLYQYLFAQVYFQLLKLIEKDN